MTYSEPTPAARGAADTLALDGAVTLDRLPELARRLKAARPGALLDLAEVSRLDTAGAWLLADHLKRSGGEVVHASDVQRSLIETVTSALSDRPADRRRAPGASGLERLGRGTVAAARSTLAIIGFLGLVVSRLAGLLIRPGRLRLVATVAQVEQAGLGAIPIVALMSFLIGIVLAYQGAEQLRAFGAEVFVVELVSISILRELGVLLTAILVAGRSASAFTAAIGAAKMNEELDAMRTIGLDPVEVLVLPRLIALVVFLPALTFVADIAGLLGGTLMAWLALGVSPGVFQTRLLDVDPSHFLVGMAKAPIFAAIIAIVGCFQGMSVQGDTESLGRLTSRSVVQAIFAVIVADAAFSILFSSAGI